jgi:UDP-N-acetylmuramoyl-L-alanyl-D-glutamate--2,6-diaminopimelate ligase
MIDLFRKILGQRILNYYHLATEIVANFIYGFPSRRLRMIGVTGTDGKTTTVNMIASILREAGFKTAHLSTVNAQIGSKIYDTGLHTTTPSSFLLQKFLKQAAVAGCEYFVLETTSHSLDQHRTWGIRFETAVITNISHEHLDYHKTYEEYVRAKAKLLNNARAIILNADDKSLGYLTPTLSDIGEGERVRFGILNPAAASKFS